MRWLICCVIGLATLGGGGVVLAATPARLGVAGFFSVYTSQTRNPIDVRTVQEAEAVRWVLQKLNERKYLGNLTIGLDAFESNSSEDTSQQILRLFQMYGSMSDLTKRSKFLIGIIGPSSVPEIRVASSIIKSLPGSSRLLLLPYSPNAEPAHGDLPYVYSSSPANQITAQVILHTLERLKWNYIALFRDNTDFSELVSMALEKERRKHGVCIGYNGISEQNKTNMLLSIYKMIKTKQIHGIVLLGSAKTLSSVLSLSQSDSYHWILASPDTILYSNKNGSAFLGLRDIPRGCILISPRVLYAEMFSEHWEEIFRNSSYLNHSAEENTKWLRKVESQESASGNIQQPTSVLVGFAMIAAYRAAFVAKRLLAEVCGNPLTVCDQLWTEKVHGKLLDLANESASLNRSRFPFLPPEFRDDEPTHEVYNYQMCSSTSACLVKIGEFGRGRLVLNETLVRWYNGSERVTAPLVQCSVGSDCTAQCSPFSLPQHVVVQEGDFYLVSLVPVHEHDGDNRFSCLALRKVYGVETVESILYAIQGINQGALFNHTYFQGRKLGVIIINTCYQPLLTREKLLSLFSDTVNGRRVEGISSKILGIVGGLFSSITVPAAEIATAFKYPMISYGATTPKLSNREKYPYFLRVSVSDLKQADIIIKLCQKMEWLRVSLIYTDDVYGNTGKNAVLKFSNGKVCVVQAHSVSSSTNYFEILEQLRKTPSVRVVILFLQLHDLDLLWKALKGGNMSPGEFLFIGSEAWGKEVSMLSHSLTQGSITVALDMGKNEGFNEYLKQRTAKQNGSSNPWLYNYIQAKRGCYFPGSYNKSIGHLCLGSARTVVAPGYQQDIWASFAIRAVYAMAVGMDEAVKSICKQEVTCDHKMLSTSISIVIGILNNVTLEKRDGDQQRERVFDAQGDGNIGYAIYNVQRDSQSLRKLSYVKVGQWNRMGLKFHKDKIQFPNGTNRILSTCDDSEKCPACEKSENESEGITKWILTAVCFLLVLLLFFVIISFILYKKKLPADVHLKTKNQDHITMSDFNVPPTCNPAPAPCSNSL